MYNIYILNLYSKLPNSSVNLSKQLNISCLCTFKFQILQVINVGGHKYIAISFRVSLNGILRSNNAAITQKMQIKKKIDIKWKICRSNKCVVSFLHALFGFYSSSRQVLWKPVWMRHDTLSNSIYLKMLQLRSFSSFIMSSNLKIQTNHTLQTWK